MDHNILKKIPAVNNILELPEINELVEEFSHNLVANTIRAALDEIRRKIASDIKNEIFVHHDDGVDVSIPKLINLIRRSVQKKLPKTHEKAINATGIILHTGLGRAPIPAEAIKQLVEISNGYSTLEIDKDTGERGSRYKHIQSIICTLTGAPDALLVNNNAAAVLLALDTFAKGKEVIVSRSQLVEIGGSFRMPEIMEKSGAILVEVGTTNRTYISDYKNAISEKTGLILIVHPSNFRISGFTSFPTLKDIAALGKEHNITTLYDLGSGAMIDFKEYNAVPQANLPITNHQSSITNHQSSITNLNEPTVKESVDAGIDVVTFSTDKLLGGPQGGLIIGKSEYVDLLKQNPLLRVLRVDKMTIAALDATLRLYLNKPRAIKAIPVLKMIHTSTDDIAKRAKNLKNEIVKTTNDFFVLSVTEGSSEVGGGSCPDLAIPTMLLSISSKHINATDISKQLRLNDPPVFGRIERNMVLLDLRTVIDDGEEREILKALQRMADNNTS
ncbi:MAG: L-seryl-tRNA(Sec) selenium transferase [Candidatus Anammoxibacter sp.]